MKKRIFRRIGTILTAAVMLMALLIAAMPVMAEGEGTTNLLTNGDFSQTYSLTEEKTYVSTATSNGADITFPVGTLFPTGWEIDAQYTRLNNKAKTMAVVAEDTTLGTSNSIMFVGTGFILRQKVTGLTAGQNYNLSLLMSASGQNGISMTVNYLTGDASYDTSVDGSYQGSFGRTLQFCGNAVSKSEDCNINFVVPAGADGAEIVITANGGTSQPILIDNVVLTEGDELITNGRFENYRSDVDNFSSYIWNIGADSATVYPKDASAETITGTATDNYAGLDASTDYLSQTVRAKVGEMYRLSFDYAQSGFDAGDVPAPDVSLSYSNTNGEGKPTNALDFVVNAASRTDENGIVWTRYEKYFEVPLVADGYAFDMVNLTLKLTAGAVNAWPAGAIVYYDDISLVEAEPVNLVKNGDFSETFEITEENKSDYAYTDAVSLAVGTKLPADWTLVGATGTLTNAAKLFKIADSQSNLKTSNVAYFKGSGFTLKQNVEGLTPGKNYNLSLLIRTATGIATNAGSSVTATIVYLYDDGFNAESDLQAALCGGSGTGNAIEEGKTQISQTFYGKLVNGSKHTNINFTLPDGAYGVEINIIGSGGTSSDVYVDNVVLCESDELVSNGTFESYYYYPNTSGYVVQDTFTAWSYIRGVYPKVADETTGLKTDTTSGINRYAGFYHAPANASATASKSTSRNQGLLVKPGTVYKLRFKFAHEDFAENAVITPVVSLTYTGKNGEAATEITPVLRAASKEDENGLVWTSYETYIVPPEPVVEGGEYAFDLVNAYLTTSVGAAADTDEWKDLTNHLTTMVYYDDVSLMEADAATMMRFATGTAGEFVTTAEEAKAASLIYVQGATDNAVQRFIVAKYMKGTGDKPDRLESVTTVDVGEGVAAGKANRYDVELDAYDENYYYKTFLWKDIGTTLQPGLKSMAIGE